MEEDTKMTIDGKSKRRKSELNQGHHDHVHHARLTAKEKMIIRLEHLMDHNRQHETTYAKLAEEAASNGAPEAGQHIQYAKALTETQNQSLEKALANLRIRFGRHSV
jgi:hypothetical protein